MKRLMQTTSLTVAGIALAPFDELGTTGIWGSTPQPTKDIADGNRGVAYSKLPVFQAETGHGAATVDQIEIGVHGHPRATNTTAKRHGIFRGTVVTGGLAIGTRARLQQPAA